MRGTTALAFVLVALALACVGTFASLGGGDPWHLAGAQVGTFGGAVGFLLVAVAVMRHPDLRA
jgi:hypothetical protein